MSKALVMIGVTVRAAVTSAIEACEIKARHYNAAFSQVTVGDSEGLVVSRLGTRISRIFVMLPRHVPNLAPSDCGGRCQFLPGIEGWSVELGEDRNAVRTTHWMSP
jgi:hypothetical protein